MIVVAAVDLLCLGQMGKGFGAKLFEVGPLPDFGRRGRRRLATVSLPAPSGFPIDLLSEADSDEALYERYVGESTGEIAVLRIAFLVFFNRMNEVLERLVIPALAARDSAVGGLDVAAGHIVVSLVQNRFRLLQDVCRFSRLAFLKH
jgi:hypothetical protein